MPVEGFKSITVKTEYYQKLLKIGEKLAIKKPSGKVAVSKVLEKVIDDWEMFK